MEGAESSRYVAQLKAEFDSCDSTCSGFLDRLELTELCRKLQLEAHLPLLLDTLLGGQAYARVNFEEFKDGFVAVLSRSLDFSTSEDDSSYLQPVVPEEVKPKFVKGTKRYGRRSRPDSQSDAALTCDSEDSPPSRTEASDSSPAGVRRAKLRRSTSLESVESLKSDEEAGSHKSIPPDFQSKGGQQEEEEQGGRGGAAGGRGGGAAGGARGGAAGGAFDPGLQELDVLDNRVSLRDFQKVLCGSAPVSCSTPVRGADLQRAPSHMLRHSDLQRAPPHTLRHSDLQRAPSHTLRHSDLQRAPPHTLRHSDLQRAPPHTLRHSDLQRAPPHTLRHSDLQRAPHMARVVLEERSVRSTSPSLLTATVGQKVLSRLDDGSGCTSPDRVIGLWTEEGIRNSRDILQTLDFSLEERLSLVDLTLALDNELLVSGNGIQQAALISYKTELQHLQVAAEQACRERDKVKSDLDLADQRNLQLVREVDDRHASMETLNQSRIRDLEQDFRDRLTALRSQSEQESEALLQQAERERSALQEELQLLRVQEAQLQEELCSATKENGRLEDELSAVKLKLTEAQSSVTRLQRDLDQLLQDKFGSLDPAGSGLSHEERFTELIREYELRCRELRDRNDELNSELELLKSQKSDKKTRRSDTLSWKQQHTESDSDDSDMQRSSSPRVRKKLQPADKTALSSLAGLSGPSVSIQTELALEQLKQKHKQELQQLHIQLETQVNYYERSQELMKQSMEVERKDICQAFKLEISELEEQKAAAEQQVKQLKEAMEKLQTQIQHGGGGGGGGRWSSEQERRMQRERAELEQNFARELSNLLQRLSGEKDQLEAELRLQMDQKLLLLREEVQEEVQEEAQQQLSHMKLQHADAQQRLLQELQELQEQRAFWENRLIQSEQEKLQREFSTERRRKEEQQELIHTSSQSISQSEASYLIPERSCVEEDQDQEDQDQDQEQEEEAKDQTISALRSELDLLQEATRSKEEHISRLTAELDSLRTDRARLIQDLKEQAMAVDPLRLELDSVSEELSRRRSAEERLQEALRQEQSGLQEEREEVVRLSQEVQSYTRLVNQLSTQIVEMEEEITSLRDHLRDLSAQLNDTADLVLDLRTQLNSRSGEAERLRGAGEVQLLQRALKESGDRLRSTEEDFEKEKRRMTQQLMELETLVLDLEEVMDPSSPHRTQLEEVRSDNGALQERLTVLQQEVTNLEDDVARKRRKLDEMEQDHKRSREEEERLHKENSRYREEVLDLSSRNLQLSNDNAELSARLHGDQESVRMLQEHLATVTKEQEEEGATVRRLQDEALQQEAAWTQQEAAWTQQRQQLQRELSCCREKLSRVSELEEELSSVTLKHQRLEENKNQLLRDADARNAKVEQLQQAVLSLQTEAELLRSQLLAVTQEKVGHAQEVTDVHRKLQDAQNKVEQLEVSIRRLMEEKEELQQVREEQEQQASVTQQEETHKLRVQNQELQHKLAELQVQSLETQKLIQEQQNLNTKRNQLETARMQDQVQQLQELQTRLQEEQRRSQQLEEVLRLQAQQSCSQISIKQGQYEKAVAALQQRMEELEAKLKAVRVVLQEKVEQLKEQMVKNRKLSVQLQEVYVETGQLMKALQVTERRQKHAEKKNFLLEEKMAALNNVLRDVVQAALAT